jgi:glycine dehydrogenase subunit 1
MRKMPGRIVGETVDNNGKRGYVLTLQAREQHIRREKSTSNICSNQALCALAATVYLATVGYKGLRRIGVNCVKSSHYLKEELSKIPSLSIPFPNNNFFNEFVVDFGKKTNEIFKLMMDKYDIAPGIPLEKLGEEFENMLLITTTEKRTKEEIDKFVKAISEVMN